MNKENYQKVLAKHFFFKYSVPEREKVVFCGKLLNDTKGVQ
jgi:hypothetical protein